jgi:hypothetical protein
VTTRVRALVVGLGLAVGVAAGGCADYVGDDIRAGDYPRADLLALEEVAEEARRTDEPRVPVPADPRTLEVGACFDDLDGPPVRGIEWGREVDVVPCPLPHRYELYARVDLGDLGGPWPGAAAVEDAADRRCLDAFETFVASEWATSELDYVVLSPDQPHWDAGDTRATCVLFGLGLVELEGSVEGSGR